MPIDPFDWVYDQPYLSVWDMMARGKPGPGPDFVRHANSETGLMNLKLRLKLKDYEDKVERDQLLEKVADKTGEFNDFVDYEYLRALYDPRYTLNILHKGITYPDVPFMRGGLWGTDCFGPNEFARSDVFLLGKHPGQTEINRGRNFVGPTSQDLIRACKHCGIPEEVFAAWYVTNLVKFDRPGGGTGELSKSWIADCLPILWQELIWVRPRYILCLGSEAIKSLMGTGHNVSNTAGRMLPFTYKAAPRDREVRSCADLEEHTATVVCIPHPSYIYHKPAAYDELQLGLGRFWDLARGRVDVDVREEAGIRHMAVYSEPILARVVDKIRARPGDLTIAFDAEWHGQHWNDETSYLRTIQFSPAWRESYCVVLNDVGGTEIFRPGAAAAIAQLRRLVADKPDGTVRVGGHAFRADMPWLIAEGLDLRSFFDIPEDHDPRVMPRGFDTLYLAHAAHESTESFKLENLAMRYTSCPRWDVRLQDWKDRYCKEHGLKDRDLEGYGMCPEAILVPYGNYDADATRRLTDVFWGHCVEDSFRRDPITGRGLDSRVAYLNSMQAWLGFLEMEMIGIEVDVPRAESLIKLFNSKAIQLVDHLRDVLGWPNFNPRSSPMCRELLFGQLLNGTVDKTTGQPRRLRPEGCDRAEVATPEGIKAYPIPLGLTPIKTTGKPPKPWERVVADDEVQKHSASTDKETLGILGHDNDVVRLLRDIRFLAQVGTMVLRPPKSPAAPVSAKGKAGKVGGRAEKAQLDALIAAHQVETSDVRAGRAVDIEPVAGPGPVEVALGHDDEWGEDAEYDGGFLYYLDRDGRVRSHFYAAETGRCTSARPNLQNLAKQRDADYQRILGYYDSKKHREVAPYKDVFGGLCYQYAIRTICRASPGCVLLEWDLMSAEIAMLAWEADDAVMIDDVRRAMLPEGHPEHIDLHAATAVSAFHLDCPPTKKGLDSIGMLHIRTPAKNVRFGVPYGRSADAIARQCREQGAPVSRRDAQTLIDGWHARYRDGSRFLVNCGNRVMDPGWMRGPFGRLRRFPETLDRKVLDDMKREAQNFLIQNGVADTLSIALYNLVRYRDANRSEGDFRILLQIHDAALLEVPIEHVPWVHDHVLPRCIEGIDVRPLDMDGRDTILRGRPPYHFGIDREVYLNWGEHLTWGEDRNRLIKAGLGPEYLPKEAPPTA